MVVAAFRAAITQARSAACFVGYVVLKVAGGGGSSADRTGAGGVPDLGQVAELDPGVVALSLEPVVAVAGGDRVERDDQVWLSAGPGAQLPGAVSAGRAMLAGGGEGESRPRGAAGAAGRIRFAWWVGFVPASCLVLGFWPGAPMADGVPVLVGHGYAPGRLGVLRGSPGEVAGQGGVIQSRSKYNQGVNRNTPSEAP